MSVRIHKRTEFDPARYRNQLLTGVPHFLVPHEFTDFPVAFFAEGSNPYDMVAKPETKTVTQYLRSWPRHIDALRVMLGYNLIMRDDDVAALVGIDERNYYAATIQADSAVDNVRPMQFLKDRKVVEGNMQLRDDLQREVGHYFKFAFDDFKIRTVEFADVLAGCERGNITPDQGTIIKQGVKMLIDLKEIYGSVTERLYALVGTDIDRANEDFYPFRRVLGALAADLRNDIWASRGKDSEGRVA